MVISPTKLVIRVEKKNSKNGDFIQKKLGFLVIFQHQELGFNHQKLGFSSGTDSEPKDGMFC